MAPTNKKQNSTREDILTKKRESEKARLARIKSDPIKLAEYREKQRLQYLKKKEKGQRKNVKEMTPREQRLTRKKWKKYSLNYRQKKQQLKQTTHNFIDQNTPSTTEDEMQSVSEKYIVNEDRRAKEAKKRSERQRKFRNKQLKKMEATVSKLRIKLNTQRQKYKRVKKQLKKVIKSAEKTPKTIIEEMSKDVTKKKELVKRALFGEVIKVQLEENYSKMYVLACKLQDMYPNFVNYSWNFHEAGHGKGAPDGIGATCKRTADQVIATGGDITNLKEFATVIRERCPGIKVDVIEGSEIEQMNTFINDKASEMVAFKGTLLVHQVVGSAYIPNSLKMKTLSCFCNPDGCDHFKLGSIYYQTESSDERTRLQTSTVFTDSEDDDMIPLSTYAKNHSKLHSPPAPEVSGCSQQQSCYSSGDYVLVKYVTKKTEYHYAAICSSVDDEEGELRVTFLKICDRNGTLFKLDERDVSYVPIDQIIKKLPVPNLNAKGNRVFYQFKEKIDVIEK